CSGRECTASRTGHHRTAWPPRRPWSPLGTTPRCCRRVRSSFLQSRPVPTTPSIGPLRDTLLSVFPGHYRTRGHTAHTAQPALQDGGAGDEVGDARRDLLEGARRSHHACDLGLLDPADAEASGATADPAPADEIPAARTGHEDDRLDVAFGEVPAAVQVGDPQHPARDDRLLDDRGHRDTL